MRAYPARLEWLIVTAPHRTRAGRCLLGGLVLLIFLVVLLAWPSATPPPPPPPATLAPTAVLSWIERAGNVSLARDCGYSAPLPAAPGRSLWLFCDTPVYVRAAGGRPAWALRRFITGSTAAEGPVAAGPGTAARRPGPLSEVGTPRRSTAAVPGAPAARASAARAAAAGGGPAPFLGPPAGLVTPAGLPCRSGGGYAASWVSGVTAVPSSPDLLITFTNYCVLGGHGGYLPEGFGLAEYDPATRTLSRGVTVFSGMNLGLTTPAWLLGSPVFSGSYLYLFGPTCTAQSYGRCATGTLFEARVPANPAAWTDPLRYRWRSGGPLGPWTPDATAASSVITGAKPYGVSVAGFPAAGRRFVLVEQTDIGGAFTVYESPAPAGAWTRIGSGRVPCRAGPGFANFCRAIIGHPELSTPAQLVLSYFNPAAAARGHVMVAGFQW